MQLLTEPEIQAIKDRVLAASRGPWERAHKWIDSRGLAVAKSMRTPDVDFIASARSDVPRLVLELEYWKEKAMDYWQKENLHPHLMRRLGKAWDMEGKAPSLGL